MSRYYTLKEVGAMYNLNYRTLHRWYKLGILKAAPRRVPGLQGPSARLCISHAAMRAVPEVIKILDARTPDSLREQNREARRKMQEKGEKDGED